MLTEYHIMDSPCESSCLLVQPGSLCHCFNTAFDKCVHLPSCMTMVSFDLCLCVWRKNTYCTGVTSVCKGDLRYLMFFMPLLPYMYANTFYIMFVNILWSIFTSITRGDLKNCLVKVCNYCCIKVFMPFSWQLGSSEVLVNSCVNI